jgi:CubicO group peptidase (beta-lactamase class C family)
MYRPKSGEGCLGPAGITKTNVAIGTDIKREGMEKLMTVSVRLIPIVLLLSTLLASPCFSDDLDKVVQESLAKNQVPGAVVAIVKNCEIAQSRAWGVQARVGGGPMTTASRLQAASIGKPVGALAILKTVQAEPAKLDLDRPLGQDASRYGMTPANWAAEVTLRHLLSHQASLGNSPLPGARVLSQKPGSMFKYSGVGYRLAQDIAEQRTGKDFESLADAAVFTPMGMTSSSYNDSRDVAPGEMSAGGLLKNGAAPSLLAALVVLLGSIVVRRFTTKSWGVGAGQIALAGAGATLAAGTLYGVFMGPPSLITVIPLFGTVALAGWASGALLARRYKSSWAVFSVSVLGAAIAGYGLSRLNLPIKTQLGGEGGNIAYSLTSTAPDLARFAIGVMRPETDADKAAAAQLTTPITSTPKGMKWGMGLGTYEDARGPINWQWGANPGYSGLLVLAPTRCEAIIVLTNGEKGAAVGRAVVKALWGVDVEWRV